MAPKIYQIRQNNANYTAITLFKVIQGHRFWYQSKALKPPDGQGIPLGRSL